MVPTVVSFSMSLLKILPLQHSSLHAGDRSIATFKWYAGRDMTYRQCHEIAQRIAHTTGELPVECRDYGDIELRLKRDRANVSKSKIDAAIAFEGMANAGRSPAAAEASR
mmetsp:Transcript_12617/g.26088  ORF Transcript_12617/g.26088 Transcript_12617/m.26088 type:complete len:110 (+) Transcript_12617:414-743(+)